MGEAVNAMLRAPNRNTAAGKRDHALLLFMYNTGARVQETADLRISWISLPEPATVQILGKGQKLRTCPLWPNTTEVLKEYLQARRPAVQDDDFVFLNRFRSPITRFGIANLISKHKEAAATKLPSLKAKRVSPHTIRRTTAMHMLQAGVEMNVIQHWLGHANLETTQRYVEIDLDMKRRAMKVNCPGSAGIGQSPIFLSHYGQS